MALGRVHPSDEYDVRIAVEEGEGGSLNGKWVSMLVDEIEYFSGEAAQRQDRIAALEAELDALRAALEQAHTELFTVSLHSNPMLAYGHSQQAMQIIGAALAGREGEG